MPTYEYRCGKCGEAFERFQSITADPVVDCPLCEGKETVERLISGGSGLIFKGSGFYITDYRSSSYEASAKRDKDASSPSSKPKDSAPSDSASSDSGSSDGGSSKGSSDA